MGGFDMSMFFVDNDEFISFRDFCLCESIKPKAVLYGTNATLDNLRWIEVSSQDTNGIYTFIQVDQFYYLILLQTDGEVMFGASDSLDFGLIDDITYISKTFTDTRRDTNKVLRVFGNIIYIILQATKELNVEFIKFYAANEALSKAYIVMFKNKHLLDSLKEYGWIFNGMDQEYYTFTKEN